LLFASRGRATISKRVNDIPGFDWQSRREFVAQLFGEFGAGQRTSTETDPSPDESVQEVRLRVEALEGRLEESARANGSDNIDPERFSKAVHACMDAEYISWDEELQLLESVLADHTEV
jgi:hypothetical protein